MITLHHSPGTAGMTPHLLLLEMGLPHRIHWLDTRAGEHKSPAYLALNPSGLMPALVDGEAVVFETAAIVLHLCETHPEAGLAPPVGDPLRPAFLKWLVWLSASLQSLVPQQFFAERLVAPGNAAGAAEVRAQVQQMIAARFDVLEAEFARHGGPWVLGERFSALDAYAFMLGRWTRAMPRPARTLPHVGAFLQRMLDRPAVQRLFEVEKLAQPWI
jgi:glutathione S-transferase